MNRKSVHVYWINSSFVWTLCTSPEIGTMTFPDRKAGIVDPSVKTYTYRRNRYYNGAIHINIVR